jgi:hypothetical protein
VLILNRPSSTFLCVLRVLCGSRVSYAKALTALPARSLAEDFLSRKYRPHRHLHLAARYTAEVL